MEGPLHRHYLGIMPQIRARAFLGCPSSSSKTPSSNRDNSNSLNKVDFSAISSTSLRSQLLPGFLTWDSRRRIPLNHSKTRSLETRLTSQPIPTRSSAEINQLRLYSEIQCLEAKI